MSDNIHDATDGDFADVVLGEDGPVIVDFWAPWCGPCRMQTPVLERFAADNPGVKVVKVNVDDSPQVAGRFGIRAIPTIGVFAGGELVGRAVGVQNLRGLGRLVAAA